MWKKTWLTTSILGLEARNKQQQKQGKPSRAKLMWVEAWSSAPDDPGESVPMTVIHWTGRAEGLPVRGVQPTPQLQVVHLLSSSLKSRAVFKQTALGRDQERFPKLGGDKGEQQRSLSEFHRCVLVLWPFSMCCFLLGYCYRSGDVIALLVWAGLGVRSALLSRTVCTLSFRSIKTPLECTESCCKRCQ